MYKLSLLFFIVLSLSLQIACGEVGIPVNHNHNHNHQRIYHTHPLPSEGLQHSHNNRFIEKNNLIKIIKNSINTKKYKKYGYYSKDKIRVLWLNDGRKSKLLETLIFTDTSGREWVAPKGHTIDGASIPAPFQPLVGTPYGGKYVMASIIHDVACDEEKASWKDVHKMFHYAMLASGVDAKKASLMYKAVYEGGPRWGKDAEKKLSKNEFKMLISKAEFKILSSDFNKKDEIKYLSRLGILKSYGGSIIYTGMNKNNAIIGFNGRYNNFTIGAEAGTKKSSASINYTSNSNIGKAEHSFYIESSVYNQSNATNIGYSYDPNKNRMNGNGNNLKWGSDQTKKNEKQEKDGAK